MSTPDKMPARYLLPASVPPLLTPPLTPVRSLLLLLLLTLPVSQCLASAVLTQCSFYRSDSLSVPVATCSNVVCDRSQPNSQIISSFLPPFIAATVPASLSLPPCSSSQCLSCLRPSIPDPLLQVFFGLHRKEVLDKYHPKFCVGYTEDAKRPLDDGLTSWGRLSQATALVCSQLASDASPRQPHSSVSSCLLLLLSLLLRLRTLLSSSSCALTNNPHELTTSSGALTTSSGALTTSS